MSSSNLLSLALECGAAKAILLRREQIVTSPVFREICQSNSCGQYGRCWVCPPEVGEIHALIESFEAYTTVLWYQSIASIEDSFDIEGMFDAGREHAQLSQRISAALSSAGFSGFLHLSCGGCHLCDRCAKQDQQPCRHPDKALGSLEGYGVDVYSTTKDTPLPYINGANTVTYFGAVFFLEE